MDNCNMRHLFLLSLAMLVSVFASGQENSYVDLGLSVKWATVNTGTTAQRPYGWYYRWPDAMAIETTDGSRMGTKAEWDELREYCTWKWTKQKGLSGYLVTSKIKGFTDKSIFLPASGWLQDGNIMQQSTYASYWCSTPGVQPNNESAYGFYITGISSSSDSVLVIMTSSVRNWMISSSVRSYFSLTIFMHILSGYSGR